MVLQLVLLHLIRFLYILWLDGTLCTISELSDSFIVPNPPNVEEVQEIAKVHLSACTMKHLSLTINYIEIQGKNSDSPQEEENNNN